MLHFFFQRFLKVYLLFVMIKWKLGKQTFPYNSIQISIVSVSTIVQFNNSQYTYHSCYTRMIKAMFIISMFCVLPQNYQHFLKYNAFISNIQRIGLLFCSKLLTIKPLHYVSGFLNAYSLDLF